jgi:predicted amidohydrolase
VDLPDAPLTVAAGQAGCVPLDVPANVATAAELVHRAAGAGADLLVLPELFLTGYELPGIVADPAAYTLDGADPRLDPLAAACADTRTAVVVSAPTRSPESLSISALVLGRDGGLVGRYDKQHLDDAEREAGFRTGTSGCTLTVDGWRLGLGICRDVSFPEHARAAALDGCHAYLASVLYGQGKGARQRSAFGPARALDCACFVALANHSGPSGPYHGCAGSGVWGPDGSLLADAGTADPGVAVATLDPSVLARVRASDYVLADPALPALTASLGRERTELAVK